jgi:hypothetical protein
MKRQSTVSLQEFSLFMLYECIKNSNNGEKVDIETFVITEDNRTQGALYNQKLSSFNISSHRLPSHHVPPFLTI